MGHFSATAKLNGTQMCDPPHTFAYVLRTRYLMRTKVMCKRPKTDPCVRWKSLIDRPAQNRSLLCKDSPLSVVTRRRVSAYKRAHSSTSLCDRL